ncbi:MAG: xanthine dehydrogenase small subunit, partial [Halieaceae bacterium]
MIEFLLDEQLHTLENTDPNTTVLDYLRERLHRTGTKEGCASGDCGACTVVTGELTADGAGDNIEYRAINACITPVASLHGKQLITVENLRDGDNLHPVQKAMVDCHGSQCGFCTPGFVMSMFAYRKTNSNPDRASINEALGGNLCRCTGYRPIIDAAVQMYEVQEDDQFTKTLPRVAEMLSQLQHNQDPLLLEGAGKSFFSPTSSEALAKLLLQYPNARLLAGGTDLCLEITQFLQDIEILIYTGRVVEMKKIRLTADALEIGAAVTYTDASGELVALYPDLHELIDRLGSRQIRNQGTLGGNVGNASPIGDMPPVLIALGATLTLRRGSQYREMAAEDYFVSYKVT